MSTPVVTTCGHGLSAADCASLLSKNPLSIRVDNSVRDAFVQLNEQLNVFRVACPVCTTRLTGIAPRPGSSGAFPLTDETFARLSIPPLAVDLKANKRQAAETTSILFQRIELQNIVDGGKSAQDDGRSYRALAELANDCSGLVSMLGPVVGRLLYWLPTEWKAKVFIGDMQRAQEKGLAGCTWLMRDVSGATIGMINLDELEAHKFAMGERLDLLNLYNVGVLLHSNYQRRGVVTAVTSHLYEALGALRLNMDGLWIRTRPDNEGVNHIAKKLGFEFLKTMSVAEEALLPCCSTTSIPQNLYYKLFDRA